MYVINSQGSMIFSHPPAGVRNITPPWDLSWDSAVAFITPYVGKAILLLEGGADVSPILYGEEKKPYSSCHPSRDKEEVLLYNVAKYVGMPILGICRGHQLMCALEGGTLYQDLDKERGEGHPGEHRINHTVHSMESDFYELMRSCPLGSPNSVNSYHHQGTKDVPPNAKILATAHDGLVEALLYEHGASVQWHPEFLGHSEFITWMMGKFLKVA